MFRLCHVNPGKAFFSSPDNAVTNHIANSYYCTFGARILPKPRQIISIIPGFAAATINKGRSPAAFVCASVGNLPLFGRIRLRATAQIRQQRRLSLQSRRRRPAPLLQNEIVAMGSHTLDSVDGAAGARRDQAPDNDVLL
jgi:hypothetical protein